MTSSIPQSEAFHRTLYVRSAAQVIRITPVPGAVVALRLRNAPIKKLAKMAVSSSGQSSSFETLIASLPNIPDKEVVLSELDGAVLLSSTVVALLMCFTLR
jgi:hypothetical protein